MDCVKDASSNEGYGVYCYVCSVCNQKAGRYDFLITVSR